MVFKFKLLGLAGYALVHFNKAIFLHPCFFASLILSAISSIVEIPVDKINGLPVLATFLIKGISVFSKEDILYAGTFNFSKKSTEDSSNTLLNAINPYLFANLKISACHSHGVYAFLNKSYKFLPFQILSFSPMKILL